MFKIPYGNTVYRMEQWQIEAQCRNPDGQQDRIKRGDFWVHIASKIFGVPKESITPAMRWAAKKRVYG